jgi:predicted glutamine amidotransferase
MCRLLGYVSERPTSLVDVLGRAEFEAFTALTAFHDDGWGMAWYDADDGRLCRAAAARSARGDATYDELAARRLGRAGILHLRWASPGLAIRPENTHPFVAGEVAMAHNGHIAPIDRLERLLDGSHRAALRGQTDSERYFQFVLQSMEAAGDEETGLVRAVATLVSEFPTASLNALLLTPATLFAVHINSRAAVPPALKGLGIAAERVRHTDDEYFAMDFRHSPSGVHLISSGIDPAGWTPAPEDSVGAVDLASGEIAWLAPEGQAWRTPAESSASTPPPSITR